MRFRNLGRRFIINLLKIYFRFSIENLYKIYSDYSGYRKSIATIVDYRKSLVTIVAIVVHTNQYRLSAINLAR